MSQAGPTSARGWAHGGVLLERYAYDPGPRITMPTHAHDEYHLCANVGLPGQYSYRGGRHSVAPGSLTVIGPGEVHAVQDPEVRTRSGAYRVLYLDPGLMSDIASQVADAPSGRPHFRDLILRDADLLASFVALHTATESTSAATTLERDERLVLFLATLIDRHADVRTAEEPRHSQRSVLLAVDYLVDNAARNVSLDELARVAALSPTHLAKAFRAQTGIPPHAYQLQVRVQRGKGLLLKGWSVGRVSEELGFFDESHFARHFKRHVGVRPGGYAAARRTSGSDTERRV